MKIRSLIDRHIFSNNQTNSMTEPATPQVITSSPLPNQYAAPCCLCGKMVRARAGLAELDPLARWRNHKPWKVRHRDCLELSRDDAMKGEQ
jgi:hypothetical protein